MGGNNCLTLYGRMDGLDACKLFLCIFQYAYFDILKIQHNEHKYIYQMSAIYIYIYVCMYICVYTTLCVCVAAAAGVFPLKNHAPGFLQHAFCGVIRLR